MTTRAIACALFLLAQHAYAQVPTITDTTIGQIVQLQTRGCHCQGSGGRDCDSTGVYTAPYGFSIASIKEIPRANTRGNFQITEQTQPGYIYVKDTSQANMSVILENMAKDTSDSSESTRLLALAAMLSTLRVINSTSHAVIGMKCHAESHKATLGGHDNGNIGVDLDLTLLRQPVEEDFSSIMLEIIKYTQDQSSDRFNKIVDGVENIVDGQPRL